MRPVEVQTRREIPCHRSYIEDMRNHHSDTVDLWNGTHYVAQGEPEAIKLWRDRISNTTDLID